MTLEYLKSSNALLLFPMQKHTKARKPLIGSTTNCRYTEAYFDDGGDEEDDYVHEAAA
jgi:hypothetical protein